MSEQAGDNVELKEVKPALESRLGRDSPFDFGQRYLNNEEEVFNYNAWDNVDWDDEQLLEFEEKIKKQQETPVSEFDKKVFNSNPAKFWDVFYKNNRENFFKDRKWLQIEFPSLYEATKQDAGPQSILEIGCGPGNTLFPILQQNKNPDLKLYGCDYSEVAINLVKENPLYNENQPTVNASVWDLANPNLQLPENIKPHSINIAVMVFVFSALSPNQWEDAIQNLLKMMAPGGHILFRDYGRYDLAQVRFKKNRLLEDNFYVRGDGTRVYFFTEEQLRDLFCGENKFIENKIGTDKRLLVNRKKQLKMYRCWLQAKFDVPE
ncbi:hypothetical protein CANARDRAFT_7439 [[Candida] arabinofermentans NRRL YB-2248]|uniref:tRNA N(3)-methylcytidine methyltransferase n=1 Tax=[Candida] arabinofermentans NRRL YB-2248 TaxID=983967 RepID=A0A1E4T2W0_9ASCO|nr:hypothetical protein CANARDRAFT_7439 [[Candida] arabinofermentans NRRL YB-2248]